MKKVKLIKWCGFTNNKPNITREDINGYRIYAIYPNKKTAKLGYEDVRKVKVEEQ